MRCVSFTCHRQAFRTPANVPLCLDCIQALRVELGTANAASEGEMLAAIKAQAPTITYKGTSLVYYLGAYDRPAIKIGVTQNLHKRVNSLARATRRLRVLAVEPGGYYLERQRHREFRTLREPGTEWFAQAPVLDEHIARLVATLGPARCNCQGPARYCPIGR